MHERDALFARVHELESAMRAIADETARTALIPEVAFLTTRRIETIALCALSTRRREAPELHKASALPAPERSGVDADARGRASGS